MQGEPARPRAPSQGRGLWRLLRRCLPTLHCFSFRGGDGLGRADWGTLSPLHRGNGGTRSLGTPSISNATSFSSPCKTRRSQTWTRLTRRKDNGETEGFQSGGRTCVPGTGTHSRRDGRPGRGREGRGGGGGGSARCTSARPLAHCPVSGSRRLVTTGPSLDPVVALESGDSPGTGQSGWVMSTAPGRGVWSTERAQTLSSLVRYETGRTRDTRGVENKRAFISGVLLRAPPPGIPPRRPHRCLPSRATSRATGHEAPGEMLPEASGTPDCTPPAPVLPCAPVSSLQLCPGTYRY